MEKEAIRKVIEEAYVKGVHIEQNVEAIKRGFNEDFNMLVYGDDKVSHISLNNWIEQILKIKESSPASGKADVSHHFELIDVTGNAAIAKVELYKDSTHIFTDYFSLYKFTDGWKIISKTFFKHN